MYLCLPELIMKKTVTRKCNVYDSAEIRYNMILGRDVLTALALGIKFITNFVVIDEGQHK